MATERRFAAPETRTACCVRPGNTLPSKPTPVACSSDPAQSAKCRSKTCTTSSALSAGADALALLDARAAAAPDTIWAGLTARAGTIQAVFLPVWTAYPALGFGRSQRAARAALGCRRSAGRMGRARLLY
jgi:hypothetical protein